MRTLLTLILVLCAFAAGVYVGQMPITDMLLGTSVVTPVQKDTQTNEMSSSVAGEEASYQVSQNQLSAEQRALLTKFGIDADSITITAAMIACAEAKIGAARLEEIKAGATPSLSEGASLVACYQ